MKINNKFGSIWDELPYKSEKKAPETLSEAMDLYMAARSSVNNSTLKAWDSHNEMVKRSAELRKIKQRKEFMERKNLEHREENRELAAKIALENANRTKDFDELRRREHNR